MKENYDFSKAKKIQEICKEKNIRIKKNGMNNKNTSIVTESTRGKEVNNE